MNKLNHVAFIMDGNGRWGKKKNKNRNSGHFAGVQTVKKIVEASIKLKIPIVTFFVFSTENWKRPKTEINFLFNLVNSYFKSELKNVIKQTDQNLIPRLPVYPSYINKDWLSPSIYEKVSSVVNENGYPKEHEFTK